MKNNKRKYDKIPHSTGIMNCPLSFQQERVLYLSQLQPDSTLWNKLSCKHLKGNISVEKMNEAVQALANRHSVLRTRINFVNNIPVQSFSNLEDKNFQFIDISNMAQPEAEAYRLLDKEYNLPIPVNQGQLFKASLIKMKEDEYLLILKLHHIISDATTFQLLWKDLKQIYNALMCVDNANILPSLNINYHDYVVWQREMFDETKTREQEEYWLNQFSGELPILDLPTDFSIPPKVSFNGSIEKAALPKELTKDLQKLSFENKVILFSTFLSAYYILLHKYSQQEDIVIGTVFSGRHYCADIRNMAGFFINTVGVRLNIEDSDTFEAVLRKVQEKINEAYYMQDYPFERLIEKINPDRIDNRNPLFRAMFNMLNYYGERELFSGVENEEYIEPEINSTQADILFEIHNNNGDIKIYIEYNTDIFKRETIRRMIKHYIKLLGNIVRVPSAKISELDILNSDERKQLLENWNSTNKEYSKEKCIHQLFEEQALKTPESIAVKYNDSQLTYSQLNKKSNQLALVLREKGVKPNDIVAIITEKSLEMIIGILGILKAGGAYLPIDPSYPLDRIKYMLENSKANLLLTCGDIANEIGFEGQTLYLEDKELYNNMVSKISNNNKSTDRAYIIYTSGSTGSPKGVAVSHKSLHNFLCTLYEQFEGKVGSEDNCLSLANISFDVSVGEIFLPIVYGAKLLLFDNEMVVDVHKVAQTILDENITFTYIPPALLKEIHKLILKLKSDKEVKLNKLLVGVEPIRFDTLEAYKQLNKEICIVNGYGPTEATICATMYRYDGNINDNDYVPIGRPVNNSKIYILDKNNNPVPVGVPGEICISGVLLAEGYLNLPKLTESKFVSNPFEKGKLMYKTGDIGKWLSDGNIQFIGRSDNQIKLRGYRIELEEIEKTLLSHAEVKEAVVIVREIEPNNKLLTAYVVMEGGSALSENGLRKYLEKWLPSYMIPSIFVKLDALPLNQNGKVDRKALPDPVIEKQTTKECEEALTEVEKKLIEITEKLLNIKGVSINDNFFRIGGNSLLTIRFISEIEETFNISLSMMDFIDLPVLFEIAKTIELALSEAAVARN
ncbi:non-ribosomal peptide synthetase [Paramaledivibacter caminithermalis]|uniref:Amino acid adenylation domain-containing protein n=1 Tax=Paramaledivibacter caminithermalis (strain DSM 15212 / CIP 107654 / DViRD3) TaxID=1121301 RepID=A0A1M6PQR2_PARC5|nr:non-ribosomal peptide synthetase [Paramaledivibacter caminithermalis]SHK10285.1 amino acid adenylation domain-containing protein [Paramaledivibacter caminithermalis DSM 15212]